MVFIRQYISWILVLLMLFGLFGFSSTILAEKGKWTKKANMPTARNGFSTSTVNGKVYAIGGFGVGGRLTTVEEYDPKTDKWANKANKPTPRQSLATSVVNGKIYAIGGGGLEPSTMEEYDPIRDRWTKGPNMPTARESLATSAVNGKIYAIGGWGNNFLSIVEEFDTGFAGEAKGIDAKGKLPTSWGKIKSKY